MTFASVSQFHVYVNVHSAWCLNSVLNVKVVAAFNLEKALVGAFSVLTNLRMEHFQALVREQLCTKTTCPGTLYNQQYFTCDWWFNVDCSTVTSFYSLNDDAYAASLEAGR